MSLKNTAAAAIGAAVLSLATIGSALASQIFVQQSSMNSAAGGDPNIISNIASLYVGASGNFTMQNPLLIIVGVYNGMGTPEISYTGCTPPGPCPLATLTTYGLTGNSGVMFNSGDAYDTLGLAHKDSENFTNWQSNDYKAGVAAASYFELYAFALDTSLSSSSTISIDESGAAIGSYIIAYDCQYGTGSSSGCATNGDIGDTPFTNSGLISSTVPEPATLLLFGAGLAGLGVALRRRTRMS